MRSSGARLASIENIFAPIQRPYICRTCSRRFPAAIRATASFSTTARRRAGEEEASESRRPFQRATTWENLEWVGTPGWVNEYMRPRRPLRPFIPLPIDRDPDTLKDHVLKAIAETVLVPESKDEIPVSLPPPAAIAWPKGVQITLDQTDLKPSIIFTSDESRQELLGQLRIPPLEESPLEKKSESSQVSEEEPPTAEEAAKNEAFSDASEEVSEDEVLEEGLEVETIRDSGTEKESLPIEVADSAWMRISLRDPATKFEVLKRVMQRTGIKLPDNVIQECDNAGFLYSRLLAKPKPRKIAHIIKADQRLSPLQNVQIHQRRITPETEDKALGRWKIIKEELAARGLPLSGKIKADGGRKFMRWKSIRYKKNYDIHKQKP